MSAMGFRSRVSDVPRLDALPLPIWGEGWGEGVTELSRDLNPSPHPSPYGRGSRPSLLADHWSAMKARSCGARPSKSLNQACVDQQPVEPPRLRAAGAEIEQAAAALEDLLLLHEAPIERHSRPFQHHQGEIGRVERIERG